MQTSVARTQAITGRFTGSYCAVVTVMMLYSSSSAADDSWGCRSVYHACTSLKECLHWFEADPNDTGRIKRGVRENNGQLVADGGSACFTQMEHVLHHDKRKQWDRDTAGCLNPGYLEAGKRAVRDDCGHPD
jgi:hypothetical protein